MSTHLSRRAFAGAAAGALLSAQQERPRPNILWLTCEDIGPHIGAYGDRYADTPNLDRLASRAVRYDCAWSNAPVCAPARTTIISGLYPPSTGSEHMRSNTRLPAHMRMYPQYLREAGYYATNNSKEDYNLEKPGQVWDDSSAKAHWRNRAAGQPFFSIFNFLITHESQLRTRPHKFVHDPAKARVPAYHPDTPEVRLDWAQYYDNITTMDGMAGKVLAELEHDGLSEDTIVFFYGDHGSGMPRSKRWPYNSGLQVPLLIHIPEKFRHLAPADYRAGGSTKRLVSFVDLAPTLLSLTGTKPPDWMQGQAFLGRFTAPEQPYVYGFRGRMDERYDMVRSVRNQRYIYIRNYMPQQIYGQHIAYMFETPTTRIWKQLYDQGKLSPVQRRFWETKPPEELYDLENDPDEIQNLAASKQHQEVVKSMRKAQQDLARRIRDVGFLPEDEIHGRSKGSTPYEMGHDPARYPIDRVMAAADIASTPGKSKNGLLADSDSAVRYWGIMGLLIEGQSAVHANRTILKERLKDQAASVQVAAAEALGRYGDPEDTAAALATLVERADLERNPYFVALRAVNALDALGAKAKPVEAQLRRLPRKPPVEDQRFTEFAGGLLEEVLKKLAKA